MQDDTPLLSERHGPRKAWPEVLREWYKNGWTYDSNKFVEAWNSVDKEDGFEWHTSYVRWEDVLPFINYIKGGDATPAMKKLLAEAGVRQFDEAFGFRTRKFWEKGYQNQYSEESLRTLDPAVADMQGAKGVDDDKSDVRYSSFFSKTYKPDLKEKAEGSRIIAPVRELDDSTDVSHESTFKSFRHLRLYTDNASSEHKKAFWQGVVEQIIRVFVVHRWSHLYVSTEGSDVTHTHIRLERGVMHGQTLSKNGKLIQLCLGVPKLYTNKDGEEVGKRRVWSDHIEPFKYSWEISPLAVAVCNSCGEGAFDP